MVAALSTLLLPRVRRFVVKSLLAVGVPTVAAPQIQVGAKLTIGARIAGGVATAMQRRPAARQCASLPWLRWRTCAGTLTPRPSARLLRRRQVPGSDEMLPHWIPHLGVERASHHCRHLLSVLSQTDLAEAPVPCGARQSATFVTSPMVVRFLATLRGPVSRSLRQAGQHLAGLSLWAALSSAMLMTREHGVNRMFSLSVSALRLATVASTP